MSETKELTTQETAKDALGFPTGTMPPALAMFLDDRLFDKAKLIAKYMSEAEGMIPPHLLGKPQACFAVVERAITWRLSPYAVAQCTYQTPGGRVGFEGKLCQAILENSGQLEGPVKFEHYGDWSKVHGKFEIKKSAKGRDYPAAQWTDEDAAGLGVTVSAKIKGEAERREWSFDLIQAQPRNSTLWATDPKTQICYTAVRRFAAVAAPGLFMGIPFDREDEASHYGPERAKNITPRPTREDFDQTESTAPAAPVESFILMDADGDTVGEYDSAAEYTDSLIEALRADGADVRAIWLANEDSITSLESSHGEGCYEPLWAAYSALTEPKAEEGTPEDDDGAPDAPEDEEPASEAEPDPPAAAPPTNADVPAIILEESEAGVKSWKKLADDLVAAIKAAETPAAVDAIMAHYGEWVDEMWSAGSKGSANRIKREAEQRKTALGPRAAA